jgi:hypothetical protein
MAFVYSHIPGSKENFSDDRHGHAGRDKPHHPAYEGYDTFLDILFGRHIVFQYKL